MRIELIGVSHVHSRGTPFEVTALKEVDLSFESGKFYTVTGKNGAGKTTLLQIASIVLKPTTGRVLIDGEDAWKEPRSSRRRIGFAFQFPEHQMFCRTVEEEIGFASRNFGLDDVDGRVRRALELLNLDERILKLSPFALSGGEKRKVAIASVIAHEPEFLVLDEPFVDLDWVSRWELLEFFEKWKDIGKGLIVVSHHLEVLSDLSDAIVKLEKGKVVEITRV